ncbi:MAG: tyrosine-type recombinase/integrase [Bacteroidota bacterium]
MAIPKFYLEHRKDKETGLPIKTDLAVILKYSFHGQRLEYFTGVRIDEKHYKAEYWKGSGDPVKTTAPKAEDKNQKLNTIKNHIDNAENIAKVSGIPLSVEYFRNYLNDKLKAKPAIDTSVTLIQYFDQFIEGMRNGINKKTGHRLSFTNIEKYQAVKNMLIDFGKHRGGEVDFKDIDEGLYNELVNYMITEKKYALNTYGRHIRFIKTVLHRATADGFNVNMKFQRAFVGVTEPSENAYLTEKELEALYKHDFSNNPHLDRVRDIFLIGCWTGLRFGDYTNIRKEHIINDRIKMVTQKTKKLVIIPLHPTVTAILEKYNYQLPPAISNQKFNDYIQDVCREAEINEPYSKNITRAGKVEVISGKKHEFISSHSARRTFATNAFKRKISPLLIMSITGHKTETEFTKYIKITDEERAAMFEREAKW